MTEYNPTKLRVAPLALVLVIAAALVLPGCTRKNTRVLFDGNYYPTKAVADKDDRKNFVLRVQRIERGLDGARAAARYEGTRYCIENFGTSEIEWSHDLDGNDGSLIVSGGALVVSGSCVLW